MFIWGIVSRFECSKIERLLNRYFTMIHNNLKTFSDRFFCRCAKFEISLKTSVLKKQQCEIHINCQVIKGLVYNERWDFFN